MCPVILRSSNDCHAFRWGTFLLEVGMSSVMRFSIIRLFAIIAASSIDVFAQSDSAFQELERTCLNRVSSRTDSTIVSGIISEYDTFLKNEFDERKVRQFYNVVTCPEDYYIKMDEILGWDFRQFSRKYYKHLLKKTGRPSTSGQWISKETRHFVAYYQPEDGDTLMIATFLDYMEMAFTQVKAQLIIENQDNAIMDGLIRSFYPEGQDHNFMREDVEKTEGRIQVILAPNRNELESIFAYAAIEEGVGGACQFSIYHKRDGVTRDIHPDLTIAMIFAGYSTFPLFAHELAHGTHLLYYTDYGFISGQIDLLNDLLIKQGTDKYREQFLAILNEAVPGNNAILEEALAYRATLSIEPIGTLKIIPPIDNLIYAKIDKEMKIISKSAAGKFNFGLWSLLGSMLRLTHDPKEKLGDAIFLWSDFLSFLDGEFSRKQLKDFYTVKERDLNPAFELIFGIPISRAEQKWLELRIMTRDTDASRN